MLLEKLKVMNLEQTQRQTRCTSHNPIEVEFHLDEDGASVNTLEEDERSDMFIRDSSGSDEQT